MQEAGVRPRGAPASPMGAMSEVQYSDLYMVAPSAPNAAPMVIEARSRRENMAGFDALRLFAALEPRDFCYDPSQRALQAIWLADEPRLAWRVVTVLGLAPDVFGAFYAATWDDGMRVLSLEQTSGAIVYGAA